jgi:YesN/AraC family two-component response regulator
MDPRIGRAIAYIDRHFQSKIRLAHLSRASGLSTQHFVYLFKKEIGVTFKPYLKRLRIRRSQEMMRDPYVSITEVCLGVGYQDLTNFERDFKKLTNMTPRDYRRALTRPPALPIQEDLLRERAGVAPRNSE